jgi:hypothetical protein
LQSGQLAVDAAASVRAARVPQPGQKAVPSNIGAKQAGQLIVASLALQNGQRR